MIWIGIFIGGFIGMLIMALLQMRKISDLYKESDYWRFQFKKLSQSLDNLIEQWENLRNAKATSEKPK